jgi:hypothetical protein
LSSSLNMSSSNKEARRLALEKLAAAKRGGTRLSAQVEVRSVRFVYVYVALLTPASVTCSLRLPPFC